MSYPDVATLVPHAGLMCLHESVLNHDAEQVVCRTGSHRNPDNPLRRDGALWAGHAIEYGAQAMAVHGGLLARDAGEPVRPGYLAAVREAHWQVDRLDQLGPALITRATRLFAQGGNMLYRFELLDDDTVIAAGQVMVAALEG